MNLKIKKKVVFSTFKDIFTFYYYTCSAFLEQFYLRKTQESFTQFHAGKIHIYTHAFLRSITITYITICKLHHSKEYFSMAFSLLAIH
jgi:hypothetical protein